MSELRHASLMGLPCDDPAAAIRHHFAGQDDAKGMYAKETRIPAGMWLLQHVHAYDHLSILASGVVRLEVDGGVLELHGPRAIAIRKGQSHKVTAITDAVWFCIHPTDETDADKVDDVILRRE
jgi:quercetin dioxygenase-like cupin family protein